MSMSEVATAVANYSHDLTGILGSNMGFDPGEVTIDGTSLLKTHEYLEITFRQIKK